MGHRINAGRIFAWAAKSSITEFPMCHHLLMELSQTNAQKWGSVTPIWQLPVILAPQLLKFLSTIVICVSEPAS
jgi:hypothetical protein